MELEDSVSRKIESMLSLSYMSLGDKLRVQSGRLSLDKAGMMQSITRYINADNRYRGLQVLRGVMEEAYEEFHALAESWYSLHEREGLTKRMHEAYLSVRSGLRTLGETYRDDTQMMVRISTTVHLVETLQDRLGRVTKEVGSENLDKSAATATPDALSSCASVAIEWRGGT